MRMVIFFVFREVIIWWKVYRVGNCSDESE